MIFHQLFIPELRQRLRQIFESNILHIIYLSYHSPSKWANLIVRLHVNNTDLVILTPETVDHSWLQDYPCKNESWMSLGPHQSRLTMLLSRLNAIANLNQGGNPRKAYTNSVSGAFSFYIKCVMSVRLWSCCGRACALAFAAFSTASCSMSPWSITCYRTKELRCE